MNRYYIKVISDGINLDYEIQADRIHYARTFLQFVKDDETVAVFPTTKTIVYKIEKITEKLGYYE